MSGPDCESEVIAAELVLGLLDRAERSQAEHRLASEPAIRVDHAWWSEHLLELIDDEAPPPSSWSRIAARLPANDSSRHGTRNIWRGTAIAASAAALLLGAGLAASLSRRPQEVTVVRRTMLAPRLAAVLTGDGENRALVAVSSDPVSGGLRVAPAQLENAEGSFELWVIPADTRPRPLGLITTSVALLPRSPSSVNIIQPGVTLAISREPLGGSPTDKPTGPVIMKGTVVRL